MNNEELAEFTKNAHAYDVADRQKGEQRIIDVLEKFETRVRSLEDTRTLQRGMIKVITWVSVSISPGLGYVLIKGWKVLQEHKVLP